MHYYKHHISDFNNATRHLTRVERSIYRDLIDLYYDSEQPITLCMKTLCRKIIAKTDEELTAVEQVLNEFFEKTEDGWINRRCEEEIVAYHADQKQRSSAGKASAAKRAQKKVNNERTIDENSATDQQSSYDNSTTVERPLNERSTNHKPLTINHNKPEVLREGIDTTESVVREEKSVLPSSLTTRKGELSKKLRTIGIDAAPHHVAWTELLKHPDESILACAEIAKARKPDERLPLNYLVPMLNDPQIRGSPSSLKPMHKTQNDRAHDWVDRLNQVVSPVGLNDDVIDVEVVHR